MRLLRLSLLHRAGSAAPLVLRIGVGVVFVAFGYRKLSSGPSGFAGYLERLGVAAPEVVSWLVIAAELGGGLLLLAGLLTRLATLPLIATLAGAIFLVKADAGIVGSSRAPGSGLDIALLSGLVALLLLGPGRLSLDRVLRIDGDEQGVATPRPAAETSSARR